MRITYYNLQIDISSTKKEILNFLFMQTPIDIFSILTLYYITIIKAYTKCTDGNKV